MAVKQINIPYTPRAAFKPFHERTERWGCLVAHRRAGKTVAAINDIIRRAMLKKGMYALIAPFRAQIKAVAWEYLKHYAFQVMKQANEAELMVSLVNGSVVRLFGADNPDSLRGLGFDGVYMDEYGDFKPSVWGNVIRPTLSDKKGWAVFGGTPKGHNQFYDIVRVAQETEGWFFLRLPASESQLLDDEELRAARQQLSEDQYLQEYECSFDAAILGAYYGEEMRMVDEESRVTTVEYDPEVPVFTAWDLGYRDDTAIWWYQLVANEVHVLDYYGASGADISDLAEEILSRNYRYERHWLPHDARAKTLASGGKSIVEQLAYYLGSDKLAIVPDLSVQDGIQAVRRMLPRCWFDTRCGDGIEALRQYQRNYDEDKKAFRRTPRHDWCSHPADAFRMLAVAERKIEEQREATRPKNIHTITLDELWEYSESKVKEHRI
jgi:hypothetical protein